MADGAGVQSPVIIKLAIMAVGGQGGGVLTNWISDLAQSQGWHVQSTAVAGVAQRTGATIYYIEMAPDTGRVPVFSLAPAAGDVDILIAAEWMEAGRAVMRGFVTPDRTTLIASTHRALAVSEKIVPGRGQADPDVVSGALSGAAKEVIAFDMQSQAVAAGSVISASLFGALAGSGALPFPITAYEATIKSGGRSVDASLRAFAAGAAGPTEVAVQSDEQTPPAAIEPAGPSKDMDAWTALTHRVAAFPDPVAEMALHGLRKVVDFQDVAYGAEYLDRLQPFVTADKAPDHDLAQSAAKYIANAMAYDDVIRVADLKTRSGRLDRIGREMDADLSAMIVTEFLHPRAEEICATLPVKWGQWIEARPRLLAWLDRRVNRGRRVRSARPLGFLQLYLVAGLRRRRRTLLRHHREMAHVDAWLDLALRTASQDVSLATEVLRCRRLIKGYSDTHSRGQSKYDRVLGALPMLDGRDDAADWLRRLRDAALQDEKGEALDGALQTVASFAAD